MAAFFVPHECLSGAKIGINTENSKLFSIFFRCHKKNKGAQALKTCVPYVLSYYNNYISCLITFGLNQTVYIHGHIHP